MPHLTLLEKGNGKIHRVEGNEALVGRDPACGLFVEGEEAKTVSGRHARFFLEETRWFVEDTGSRNGTYIGTRKLEPAARHALSPGDVVGLGLTGTQFAVQEAVGRAFAATMLEAGPAVPPPIPSGTVPMRRSEAIKIGIHIPAGETVRVVLRDASGARFTGHGDRVTLGRALECIIRVEGEAATSVSRVHAEISVVSGAISIRDGGSRHGTFVNDKKLSGAAPVTVGDRITLGPGGPVFLVEEAELVEDGVTQPKSRANDGVFRSELPTPALERPAARKPPPAALPQAAAATPPEEKPRGRIAGWVAALMGPSPKKKRRVD